LGKIATLPKHPVTTADEMMRVVELDGWRLQRILGSHHQFRHPEKPGLVTIDRHGSKDLDIFLVKSILRQAGISREQFSMYLDQI
jgi:predicted RNA binding protein YcfA (HicA-like mRNA interferase family)